MPLHPSHKTRMSFDASTFDEICTICGATDQVPGGWGDLQYPCKGAKVNEATTQQQPPSPCDGDDIWLLVIRDMEERRKFGIAKYGQPVRADNGRDHLVDAMQEALDLVVYLRAAIEQRRVK